MPGQSQRKIDGGRIPGVAEITNCVEIIMRFHIGTEKQGSIRTYGKHQGAFNSSQAMANQLYTAISGHWLTRFTTYLNNITFDNLSIRDMTSRLNPEWISAVSSVNIAGGAAAMPRDVALVLTAVCVERGRGANGRLYVFGWGAGSMAADGSAVTGARDVLTQWGGDIMLELNAVALSAAVAKPARAEYTGLTGALHPARAAHAADVVQYVCRDTEWDTQRRRGL